MSFANHNKLAGAIALALSLTVAGCGKSPDNQSLYSVKQPVVERTNFVFDVTSNQSGLDVAEQQRLSAWFETMELGYGDKVSIDDPVASSATRNTVAQLAARHGVLLAKGAPVTEGFVEPGKSRIVITRSTADVPGCPDWSAQSDLNYSNATSPGYGCAVNSNLAAMVANPEDLIEGQSGTGETTILTSNKAIDSYRERPPSGKGGDLGTVANTGGGN